MLCTRLSAQVTITYTNGQTDATNSDTSAPNNPTTLTIASGSATQSGSLSGSGYVIKTGAGTLSLSGTNTYTGHFNCPYEGTIVKGGTLQVASGGSISHTARNMYVGFDSGDNGTLSINGRAVTSNDGYLGYDSGSSGAATVSSGAWTNNGGLFVGNSGTGALNVTGSGTVTAGTGGTGTLTLAVDAGSSGTLNLGTGDTAGTLNAATANGWSGTATVNFNQTRSYTFAPNLTGNLSVSKLGAGTTTLTGANGYTGDTTVHAGTLQVGAGGSINGTANIVVGDQGPGTATVTVSGGTVTAPAGVVSVNNGTVNLNNGTMNLTPDVSNRFYGPLIVGGAGTYDFEIDDATGTAGTSPGWDLTNLTGPSGMLNITATNANKFRINVISGDLTNPAAVANFNGSLSYQWLLMQTSAGIAGFDPSAFLFDRSSFLNTAGGQFFLREIGNDLYLNYTPVPEPATYGVLTGLGLAAVRFARRRRRTWDHSR